MGKARRDRRVDRSRAGGRALRLGLGLLLASLLPGVANALTSEIRGPEEVGRYLQARFRVVVDAMLVQDANVSLSVVDDPVDPYDAACTLSDDKKILGTDSLSLVIPENRSRVTFWVQGKDDAGTCQILAQVDDCDDVTKDVDIVQPALRIGGLGSKHFSDASDRAFGVRLGLPKLDANGDPRQGVLARIQRLRGGDPSTDSLAIDVTSDQPAYGQINLDRGTSDATQTALVAPGKSRTPSGSPGRLFFDPIMNSGGTSFPVDASSLACFLPDEQLVEIVDRPPPVFGDPTLPDLTGPNAVGAFMMTALRLTTDGALENEATYKVAVRDTSPDPNPCLLDLTGGATPGSSVQVKIPARRSVSNDLFIHGQTLANPYEAEQCELEVFLLPDEAQAVGTFARAVEIPRLKITSLPSVLSTADPDEKFSVRTGIELRNRFVKQDLSPSFLPDRVIRVETSDKGSIDLVGSGANDHVDVVVPKGEGEGETPNGALVADPIATPGAKIIASSPDFSGSKEAPGHPAERDVRVEQDKIRITGGSDEIAVYLQDTLTAKLTRRSSTGISFTVYVADTEVCRLAASETSSSSADELTFTGVKSSQKFAVRGLEEEETCKIRIKDVSDSAYVPEERDVAITAFSLKIADLDSSVMTGGAAPFRVKVGVANEREKDLSPVQTTHLPGGLQFEVCVQPVAAADLENSLGDVLDCVDEWIPFAESVTPDGALKLLADAQHPVVQVCARGGKPIEKSCDDVEIKDLVCNLDEKFGVDTVAAGLMDAFEVECNQAVTAATPVTIRSAGHDGDGDGQPDETPDDCLVAPDESTVGSEEITVTLGAGKRRKTFQVHGIAKVFTGGAEGGCELDMELDDPANPGMKLTARKTDIAIVNPGLALANLNSTTKVGKKDDFQVQVGVAREDSSKLRWKQKVRPGITPGLKSTVCSTEPDYGLIWFEDPDDNIEGPAACVTAIIPPESYHTQSSKLEFHAVDVHPGFEVCADDQDENDLLPIELELTTAHCDTKEVTSSETLSIDVPSESVGEGLMHGLFKVEASHNDGGVSVHVTSDSPGVCLVSALSSDLGVSTIDLTLPDATFEKAFWVHALEASEGQICDLRVDLDETQPHVGYNPGTTASSTATVVARSLRITGLPSAVYTNQTSEPFEVEIGVGCSQCFVAQPVRMGGVAVPIEVSLADDPDPAAALSAPPANAQQVWTQIATGAGKTTGLALYPLTVGGSEVSAVSTAPEDLGVEASQPVSIVQQGGGGGGGGGGCGF